ncbi:MAG: heliorhodopsin HeR [Tepidiformaceae bacterium]
MYEAPERWTSIDSTRSIQVSETQATRLRWYNALMGLLHAGQGVVILLLANGFSLPVTSTFLNGPPGTDPELRHLFDIRIAWGIAAFVFISAAAHWILAGPAFRWYIENLRKQRNYARWIEYSVSASIMIVLIAMLTGIGEVVALIGLIGANAAMILFGLVMEHYEQPGKPNWLAFIFGCIFGALPWIGITIYVWSPGLSANPPGFVYGIFVSLFIFFNCFALNMWLQYKRIGPWRNYVFGETVYILLSLTAKSALAWQVFFPTLV